MEVHGFHPPFLKLPIPIMKLRKPLLIAAAAFATAMTANAHEEPAAAEMHHTAVAGHTTTTITASVKAANPPWVAGQAATALLTLTDASGKPVAFADLELAHTKKIHLLLIDPSLTDYHHEHPVATDKPGEYSFNFKPLHGGTYTVFADLHPVASGMQEYDKTEIMVEGDKASLDETSGTVATVDGYRFELSTEAGAVLRVGEATLAKVKVTKPDGQPANVLEPLMGAFAHGVGFPSDLSGVVHVHPMGTEPDNAADRGGPELMFHIVPQQAGYMKFFVQVQIDGRDRFAGFGFKVEPAVAADDRIEAASASPLSESQKEFLSQYEAIRAALAADDLAAATKSAKAVSSKDEAQHSAAAAIAQSDSLKAARAAFITLSAEAVKVATKQPGYYQMSCPMVKNGLWIQSTKNVQNPYQGKAMLDCGSIVK